MEGITVEGSTGGVAQWGVSQRHIRIHTHIVLNAEVSSSLEEENHGLGLSKLSCIVGGCCLDTVLDIDISFILQTIEEEPQDIQVALGCGG